MEDITWIIYKTLLMNLTKKRVAWRWRRAVVSTGAVLAFVGIGWRIQSYFKINLNFNEVNQIFGIIAGALISLVAFVGVIVIFWLERIHREKEKIADNGEPTSDDLGKKEGSAKDLLSKLSVYTFFIVIVNLFIFVFAPTISNNLTISNNFTLPILFGDIALVGYSFRLVLLLVDNTF